jgi:hypothetical protein
MSPPGYPSACLRPRSARFRFTWQNHGNSATSCRFSTSGLPVTPPEPQTGQTRIVSCDRLEFRQLSILFGVCQSTSCARQALAVH